MCFTLRQVSRVITESRGGQDKQDRCTIHHGKPASPDCLHPWGVTPPWGRLECTPRSVFVGLERVHVMCVHVGVHAGEVMMNIRAVKVSRGEAVDGKAPMTAKQTTQEKLFQGQNFSVHDSTQAPGEQDNASTCDGWHFVNDAIISSNIHLMYSHCFQRRIWLIWKEGQAAQEEYKRRSVFASLSAPLSLIIRNKSQVMQSPAVNSRCAIQKTRSGGRLWRRRGRRRGKQAR